MASVAGSTRSSIVRARRGAPDGRGGRPPGLEQLVSRRSLIRPVASVDANGISQVPWRSVPCLCPAPGPRSSRRDLACGGLVDAAPGFHKPKASAGRKISRLTQGFSIRCLRFTSDVAATHARLASGWRAAPLPGGRRTLWTAAKGFRSHFRPPFQDLPCRKWNLFENALEAKNNNYSVSWAWRENRWPQTNVFGHAATALETLVNSMLAKARFAGVFSHPSLACVLEQIPLATGQILEGRTE